MGGSKTFKTHHRNYFQNELEFVDGYGMVDDFIADKIYKFC